MRYEEDDFSNEDRVIVKTPEGQSAILPASGRRLSGDALEVFAEVQRVGMELAQREARLTADLVPMARDLGVSWSLIGAALGITGEGARKRYGVADGPFA